MDRVITVAQVIVPIFVVLMLGILARKKDMMKPQEVQGLQNFVVKFCLPCVIFNSCLTAEIGAESVTTMIMALTVAFVGTVWAFLFGRKLFPYHNFPMFFACQETGMLGIPLFMILFGADQAFRMGVLDVSQAVVAFPVLAILSADAGENPNPVQVTKSVLTSPLMIMAALGLVMNFSGLSDWMVSVGIIGVLTECLSLLSQPVSVLMIFSVGYNFSLQKDVRGAVFKISAVRFGIDMIFCVLIQLVLFLIPNVDVVTRITMLMYCCLPISFVSPSLGRNQEEYTVASGVCSVLTAVSLLVFCVIAAFVA